MNLRQRYAWWYEKATAPSGSDAGRHAMYYFEKFCKSCGAGLQLPTRSVARWQVACYRMSYCDEVCRDRGPRSGVMKTSETHTKKAGGLYPIEQLAHVSVLMDDLNRRLTPKEWAAIEADEKFRQLDVKLAWLEEITGEQWYPKKLYRTLDSAWRKW